MISFKSYLLGGMVVVPFLAFGELEQSNKPPVIPVGLDAYTMWDRLPQHRIGARAYMRSTYDRQGNNRYADASHFLYQESDEFNVALDVTGPGVMYFKRTNHWHGSPWHYEVDGEDTIVQETATADPVNAKRTLKETSYIPEKLFPNPLTWTWSTTKGANLMWVPLPFEETFRFAYSRTFYGTGYYIYHLYESGIEHVSQPIKSWEKTPPDPKVLELLNRAGTDIAPSGEGVAKRDGSLLLKRNEWVTLAKLDGPGNIRALKFTVPRKEAMDFGKTRLRITWDDRWHASVDVPVDLFFGTGLISNDNDREYLVQGFPMNIRYEDDKVHLDCYWPMPFFQNARIEIQSRGNLPEQSVDYEIRHTKLEGAANHQTYFHATYTDHPKPVLGQDLTFLDTTKVEGGGDWSGNFVGMSWIFSRDGDLQTLEGDPRFFFDDSKTPQGWGTGTEEWGGGGDYWGGENMTLPFAGHPVGKQKNRIKTEHDLINSAYRFLIADHFPFGKNAKINLEHGSVNEKSEHYSGVVYWYGINQPTLVLSDHFNVCNERIETREHEYHSPTAEKPYILVSRYEWGPDRGGAELFQGEWGPDQGHARMYYPAQEDQVRTMSGVSTFKMRLDPENHGALLRRKFDYLYPNQRARVSIRPAAGGDWQEVGIWLTAGSNTCVYSNPQKSGELGATEHHIVTSNRRWREEEFLLPSHLTRGLDRIEIKIEHIPDTRELFPEHPYPAKSLWSESRYWLYSYKLPQLGF